MCMNRRRGLHVPLDFDAAVIDVARRLQNLQKTLFIA